MRVHFSIWPASPSAVESRSIGSGTIGLSKKYMIRASATKNIMILSIISAESSHLKAVYLLLGFIVGGEIARIPPEADAPLLPDLYHGFERHSASVPDAAAWHSWKLSKEHPLQPGLSMPWIHTGYWVAIWPEAGANIPDPHRVSNVRRMLRIVHLRFFIE